MKKEFIIVCLVLILCTGVVSAKDFWECIGPVKGNFPPGPISILAKTHTVPPVEKTFFSYCDGKKNINIPVCKETNGIKYLTYENHECESLICMPETNGSDGSIISGAYCLECPKGYSLLKNSAGNLITPKITFYAGEKDGLVGNSVYNSKLQIRYGCTSEGKCTRNKQWKFIRTYSYVIKNKKYVIDKSGNKIEYGKIEAWVGDAKITVAANDQIRPYLPYGTEFAIITNNGTIKKDFIVEDKAGANDSAGIGVIDIYIAANEIHSNQKNAWIFNTLRGIFYYDNGLPDSGPSEVYLKICKKNSPPVKLIRECGFEEDNKTHPNTYKNFRCTPLLQKEKIIIKQKSNKIAKTPLKLFNFLSPTSQTP
jgi:hypothetical protein